MVKGISPRGCAEPSGGGGGGPINWLSSAPAPPSASAASVTWVGTPVRTSYVKGVIGATGCACPQLSNGDTFERPTDGSTLRPPVNGLGFPLSEAMPV